MEVLSAIQTIGTLLSHIISKIRERSGSSSSNFSNTSYESEYILTKKEKLQIMKIDELNTCYATSKIVDYTVNRAELILLSGQINGFDITEIIKQQNCIFIKVRHSIPYNSGVNEYGTTFSINFIEIANNVMIHGFKTFNANEEKVFYTIANEIITQLSR